MEEKLREKRERQIELNEKSYDPQRFMTKFMEQAILEQEIKRHNSPEILKARVKEKISKYAKLVKDMHPPTVSNTKMNQMKIIKESIINTRVVNK